MNIQRERYQGGVGDDWYERNKKDLGTNVRADPVSILIQRTFKEAKIKTIMEIGCSNGWRMKELEGRGFDTYGIDPSEKAIGVASVGSMEGRFQIGTVDNLPWKDEAFDCVIMGFCMWALDPADWFKAVAESDRVLKDGGFLIIHDRFSCVATKRAYPNRMDVFGYSYDWKLLWLSHPGYHEVGQALGVYPGSTSIEGAIMLKKMLHSRIMLVQEPPEPKS